MHRSMLVMLVAAVMVAPTALGAVPRDDTQSYVLAAGLITLSPLDCEGGSMNFGGACFLLDGTESTFKIVVSDNSGATVAGSWSAFDADVARLASGSFCGASPTLGVPAGTAEIIVYLGQGGDPTCLPGVGTTGTVTVQFR